MTGPRPFRQPWTPGDDRTLLEMFRAGLNKLTIARKMKRTVAAVVSRRNTLLRKERDEAENLARPTLKRERV